MTTIPDWANPQLMQRSRLKPRATFVPFADAGTAQGGDRERSPFFQLLNGQWRFAYCARPGPRPSWIRAGSIG